MTQFDTEMAAMADEMIDEFGKSLTLRDPGHLGSVEDPTEEPVAGSDTDYSIKGYVGHFSREDVATNTVERDDLRILVAKKELDDLSVTPVKDWEFVIDSEVKRIKGIRQVGYTGESFALYEFQAEA